MDGVTVTTTLFGMLIVLAMVVVDTGRSETEVYCVKQICWVKAWASTYRRAKATSMNVIRPILSEEIGRVL